MTPKKVGTIFASILVLVGIASVACAQPVQLRVQTPRPVPYPNMSAQVSIVDEEGVPYENLRKQNIQVLLDDQPVTLSNMYTAFADSAHLGVVFVVDRSGSVEENPLSEVRRAIRYFTETFAPYDQVGLVTFDNDVQVKAPMGTPIDEVENQARVIRRGSNTALYDAVQRGAEILEATDAARRALILLSDGKDTRSALGMQDVLGELRPVDWPVYALGVGPNVNPEPLRQFASATNGRYVGDITEGSLSSLYDRLIRPLRGLRYVVQFPFEGNPMRSMHRLEVKVQYGGTPYRAGILFSHDLVPSTATQ